MSDLVGVLVTACDLDEARKIARGVLEKRLAACVNLVGGVESHYWWQGKIEEARECLLILKTQRERVPDLVREVKDLHSYTVPETITFAIEDGNPDYLEWVRTETATS